MCNVCGAYVCVYVCACVEGGGRSLKRGGGGGRRNAQLDAHPIQHSGRSRSGIETLSCQHGSPAGSVLSERQTCKPAELRFPVFKAIDGDLNPTAGRQPRKCIGIYALVIAGYERTHPNKYETREYRSV